jgi:predicted Rossmann fold nucleotide-binding protein DprA/Smf involved in DNA uptake
MKAASSAPRALDPDAALVLKALRCDDPIPLEDLAEATGLSVPRLLAAISALELAGLAVALPGGQVAREKL